MKRIGSLGLGQLAILGTLGSVLLVLFAFGQNMFSAGPLSAHSRQQVTLGGVSSHAEITSCSACHAPAWSKETMSDRCLKCHENIREQLRGEQPMHGLLPEGKACRNCHTEHKGPHGPVTSFAQFDHACTAFKLTGKHQQVECASCHKTNSYQGTPQSCVSCHAEPVSHKDRFGTDCQQCHSPSTWKATTFTQGGGKTTTFNHDMTGFRLRDRHATIDCKACHIKETTFKGLSQTCVSCHKEPEVHLGKFGSDCQQCHGTNNWRSVKLKPELLQSSNFDHDRTAFKLTGKHRMASCASCHTNNTFKGTSQSCVSCHAEPPSHKPHPKSFGSSCAQCHATLNWKGATLTKHTFPMNHRTKNRQNSACAVCHPATVNVVSSTGVATTSPSYSTYTCYGCHHHTPEKEARRHGKRRVANLNACAVCHPAGRKGKGKAALDREADAALCSGCPESGEHAAPPSNSFASSCPATDAVETRSMSPRSTSALLLASIQDSRKPVQATMPRGTRVLRQHDFSLVSTPSPAVFLEFSGIPGSDRSTWTTALAPSAFDLGASRFQINGHPGCQLGSVFD